MNEVSIPLKHGPPDVRHHIMGERTADQPVGGLEVLMHRRVNLTKWTLVKAAQTFWRLYWPQSTGATIAVGTAQTALRPGRLYLIPPHTTIDSRVRRPFSKWYVHFTLRGLSHPPSPGVYELAPTRRMKTLLDKTCPRRHGVRSLSPLAQPWLLIELVALVLEHAPEQLWRATAPDARLGKAVQLMNQEFATKLTLHRLGSIAA